MHFLDLLLKWLGVFFQQNDVLDEICVVSLEILISDCTVLDDRTAWNRLLGCWCPLGEERTLRVCIRKITKSKVILVSW